MVILSSKTILDEAKRVLNSLDFTFEKLIPERVESRLSILVPCVTAGLNDVIRKIGVNHISF